MKRNAILYSFTGPSCPSTPSDNLTCYPNSVHLTGAEGYGVQLPKATLLIIYSIVVILLALF